MYTIEAKITLPESYEERLIDGLVGEINKFVFNTVNGFLEKNPLGENESADADVWYDYDC